MSFQYKAPFNILLRYKGEIEQATAALQTIERVAPNVQRWIRESSTTWSRKEDYEKYADAFRIAGLR